MPGAPRTDFVEGQNDRRLLLRATSLRVFMFPLFARGQGGAGSPVRASIDVCVVDSKRVLATIVKVNVSTRPIWILKDPPGVLVECEGREVTDIGIREKRAAYTLADHEQVLPGHSVTRQVDIAAQYEWPQGTHTYVARTGGGYVDPTADEHFTPGAWATADFTLTR